MDAPLMAAWNRVRYGIPSSDPASPGFEPRRYWRGPSWPFMNALIAIGLHDAGRTAEAERLRGETADPISRGGFAMVFQSYALYPPMSVRDNIGFPLKTAGVVRAEIARKVAEAVRVLKLEPFLDRRPRELSGGQRQRVAIGRCIVRDPAAFLFDEPLSNLDAALRVEMRYEIAKLHRSLGATMIYVTHDQVEAMTLADRIVVLETGEISQVGTPRELYRRPRNLFVAQFIGSPKMNVVPCTAEGGRYRLEGGGDACSKARGIRSTWAFAPSTSGCASPTTGSAPAGSTSSSTSAPTPSSWWTAAVSER